MSNYEALIIEKEYCERLGSEYAEAGDVLLSQFYFNAAEGFRRKALQLSAGQASEAYQ